MMTSMTTPRAMSPLPTRSAPEALVVTALLRAHGIPVYIAGQLLQDEFGVSQRILCGAGATLEVPTSHLLEARALLAKARADAASDAADDSDDGPPPGP